MSGVAFEYGGAQYSAHADLMTQADLEAALYEQRGRAMAFGEVLNLVANGVPAYCLIVTWYCARLEGRRLELHEVGPLVQDGAFLTAFLEAFGEALKREGNALGLMAPSIAPSDSGARSAISPATSSSSPVGQSKPPLKGRKIV